MDDEREYPYDIICKIYDVNDELIDTFIAWYKIHELCDHFPVDSRKEVTYDEYDRQFKEFRRACDWAKKTYYEFLGYQNNKNYKMTAEDIFYSDTRQPTIKVVFEFIENPDYVKAL